MRLAAVLALVAVGVTVPAVLVLGKGSAGDDLALQPWENAVLLTADDRTATLLVVYDTGPEDLARRLRLTRRRDGSLAAGLLVEQREGVASLVYRRRCVRAEIEDLGDERRGPSLLGDEYRRRTAGEGRPAKGFVVPEACRDVPVEVVGLE